MLFYYIRHGDPIYDPDMLTENGKLQAEALSRRLVSSGISEIYASTSNRAVQTAEPLAEKLGLPITKLDWCNEYHAWKDFSFKDENGKTSWLMQDERYLKLFASDEIVNLGYRWYEHPAFAETHCADGVARIAENSDILFKSLGYEHDLHTHSYITNENAAEDKRVALFAHGGFGRAFLSYILDIPYPMFMKFEYSHTGMTVIQFKARNDGIALPKVLQYSGDSHLYKEGLSLAYNNEITI